MKQLLLFCSFVPGWLLGQGEFQQMELKPLFFDVKNQNFYVSEVVDLRADTTSIGLAKFGISNRWVPVKIRGGLENAFLNFISPSLPPSEKKYEVKIRVVDFEISEITYATSEWGFALLKLDILAKNKSGDFVKVFQTGTVESGTGMDVTKKHELRIRRAIAKCLDKFSTTDWQKSFSNPDTTWGYRPLNIRAHDRGIYRSFDDFVQNEREFVNDLEIKRKSRKHKQWQGTYSYKLNSFSTPLHRNDIWGFCDGTTAYIKHQGEYFPIEDANGHYMFKGFGQKHLENIVAGSITGALIGGIVGSLLFSAVASTAETRQSMNKPTEYLIDPYLGQPVEYISKQSKSLNDGFVVSFYRRGKKEFNVPLKLSIEDSITVVLKAQDFREIRVPDYKETVKVCVLNFDKDCFSLDLQDKPIQYIQCVLNAKSPNGVVNTISPSVGEFEIDKLKKLKKE